MKPSVRSSMAVLTLALAGSFAQAAGSPYLAITAPLGEPAYVITYDNDSYASNSHFTPEPGHVLKATWASFQGTHGQMAAELGRLRVSEFGAGRATAADGSLFGVGGSTREALFEDRLILQGRGLTPDTVMRVDYHFGGSAGGRIETNADLGGSGRLEINAELQMGVGRHGVRIREHTWATQDVLAGGQQRTMLASGDLFEATATGFSMRLGESVFGSYLFDLNWRLSLSAQCLFSVAPLPPHLPSPSGGCSYGADYGNTASFMGVSLYDGTTGALLDPASYDLRSASGFDYAQGFAVPPVPEPQTWALMALGLGLLAWRRMKWECPLG
jgi:hypothetical protein